MKIDIYRCIQQLKIRFISVAAGSPVPESWVRARYFKTIELTPGHYRIGMVHSVETVLANIEEVGWSVM